MNRPLRVVLDTNVLISAIIADGRPRRVLELCRSGDTVLYLSDAILAELGEVMRRKFGWNSGQVSVLLNELRAFAVTVTPGRRVTLIACDPADNRVLECALEARADVIVSGDTRHLQPLGSFESMPILSPTGFVAQVRGHLTSEVWTWGLMQPSRNGALRPGRRPESRSPGRWLPAC